MGLVFLEGYYDKLTSDITSVEGVLPIADPLALCSNLANGHSYLVVTSPLGSTEIKVSCLDSSVLYEHVSGPQNIPAGSCLKFTITKSILDDYCMCGSDSQDDGDDTGEDSGDDAVQEDFNFNVIGGVVCVENGILTFKESDESLAPGTYHNATVTVGTNGVITSVSSGPNVVYNQSHCCGTCGQTNCGCSDG